MERITLTELGWVLCAIDGAIYKYENQEKQLPSDSERSLAHLRKEQLQSIYERLRRAYDREDKRIAIQ